MEDRKKNTKSGRNPDSFLYKALTRIFSGPIVQYKAPAPRNLKKSQLDKFKFKSASGLPFKKSNYSPFDQLYGKRAQNSARAERYVDFEQMEHDPIMASVLDIYAYEMTISTEMNRVINIICENDEIREILENLYFDVLNIDRNIFGWCRDTCKYGDLFLYLDIDNEMGITSAISLPPEEVERLEGEDKTNPNYIQFQWNASGMTFEYWQVAHFRIVRNGKFMPYGTGIGDPARRAWRQLNLQIDAMMSYRIVRSPERRVFYIDVGGIDEEDVEQYIEKVKTDMKKNMIVDQDSGMADVRYNAFPVWKKTPIPLLDGRTITIEELSNEWKSGKQNWVYSVQDKTNKVVPGQVVWCDKNYTTKEMIKVWLDDDSWIFTAPEHPFVLRNGKKKRADELLPNDSLMPFYTKKSSYEEDHCIDGYEMIYDPHFDKFKFTHRVVGNSALFEQRENVRHQTDWGKNKNLVVHHKNFNKLNNIPENLVWVGNVDQMGEKYNGTLFHKEHNEIRKNTQLKSWEENKEQRSKAIEINVPFECLEIAKKLYQNDPKMNREEFLDSFRNDTQIKKVLFENNKRDISKLSRSPVERSLNENDFNGFLDFKKHCLRELKNHKVQKIEQIQMVDDVYCMTVVGPNGENDRHNFALCSFRNDGFLRNGVFVGNSTEEDYIIPVYGRESGTKIETLPGGQYTGDIDDVNFLQDRVLAAVKVPRSYILEGKEAGGNEDKTTLSQKDIRFAGIITNLQQTITTELIKIGQVHLYALGFRGKDLLSFNIKMNNPSKIAELQELELWKTRFDTAQAATEGFFSRSWVYKKILKLSDKDIERIHREMPFDKKFEGFLEQLVQTQTEENLGDDLDLGGDEDVSAEEEETLLAAPGKRHDKSPHLTAGSKGKVYHPVASDQRGSGARKRHMLGQGSREMSRNTSRTTLPGFSAMRTLGRGVAEEKDSYLEENYEDELLQTSKEVRLMLGMLDKSKLNKKQQVVLENKDEE